MAFKIHYVDDGHVPSIEYLPAEGLKPAVGMALVLAGGKLVAAKAAVKPTYISMCEKDAACAAGEVIPVIRVVPGTVYETEFSAAATSIKLGDKVTLHATDGMSVTATTTDGVAEVVGMDGTAVGAAVRVRFA